MGSLYSNSTVPHIHCFVSLVSWHVSSEVYCGLQQCSTLPIDLQPEEEFRRLRIQLKEIQMYTWVLQKFETKFASCVYPMIPLTSNRVTDEI